MKKFILSLFAGLLFAGISSAQNNLNAYFSFCTFNQPSASPFIETYLSVIGNSVRFSPNVEQHLQSKIEVQWVLKTAPPPPEGGMKGTKIRPEGDSSLIPPSGGGGAIVYFDKYNLLSPELNSESDAKPNFVDQKRIPVANGNYDLELTIADKNSTSSKYTIHQNVSVNYTPDRISFSDIELLESYQKAETPDKMSKNGYNLVPLTSNFFPREMTSIKFYAELYNAKKVFGDDDFIIRYEIVNEGNKQIFGDLVNYKKIKPQDVNVILAELPLDQVPSGNYSLVVEARNKKNEIYAFKSSFFQRSNPVAANTKQVAEDYSLVNINNTFVSQIVNKDTLKDYIACLYPISGQTERQIEDNQIAMANMESMKQFIFYFWSKRDAQNPEQKWLEYKAEVDKVNASYTVYNRKGYDTDRGRVYLQYGPPNTIDAGDREPNTYPYEVWHYYTLGNQSNRKFVFYSKDGASNNYELLHSDAIGEVSTYDWQLRLHDRTNQYGTNIDADKAPPAFGDKTEDRFNNPK